MMIGRGGVAPLPDPVALRILPDGAGYSMLRLDKAGTSIAHTWHRTLDEMNQYTGTCTHMYSIARPGTPLPGATNSAADPLFVDTVKGDLHLQTTSPARGAADPNSDLTGIASLDIDGTSRTATATIGAYQLKPQGTP